MVPAAELIDRIVHGDKQAEKQLIENYYQGLLFILYRQTDTFSLAEDLVQDTFVIVIRKLRNGDLRNPDALASFIRQTGINTLIAYRRQQARRQTENTEHADAFESEQESLLQQVQKQNNVDLVRRLLAQLSTKRDKDLLTRYYLYDEDKQTLCEEYALTTAHFDRVLFRARQRLRALIENSEDATVYVRDAIDNAVVLALITALAHSAQWQDTRIQQFAQDVQSEVREFVGPVHSYNQNGLAKPANPGLKNNSYV
ncbi:sigma-70 family RNA polymerase sigma factor [Aestuariibacter sp. A3R04]|uniref:RNA polymerase sigma factor n=1 Tax=Aestuariibacter sp. A3R04 TaxID=2841571 RepID=UPI001C080B43|nr:sigma-70 family RNA polymerase sigma factor [Aestuariibacter sp. A3R04]